MCLIPPELAGLSKGCTWNTSRLPLPSFLLGRIPHIPRAEMPAGDKVSTSKGSHWHELVIQANPHEQQARSLEGPGTAATPVRGHVALGRWGHRSQAARPAPPRLSKSRRGKSHNHIPSSSQSLWANRFLMTSRPTGFS